MSDDEVGNGQEIEPGTWKPGDTVYDAFRPKTDVWGIAQDGLPAPMDDGGMREGAPPLTPQNMVCLRQPSQHAKAPWLRRPLSSIVRKLGLGTLADRVDGTLPTCRFYKRQLVPFGEFKDQKNTERWCTHPAMRALNGAALNLSESAMYACELRSPPHPESEAKLDLKDDERIRIATEDPKFFRLFRTAEEAARGVSVLEESDYEKTSSGL